MEAHTKNNRADGVRWDLGALYSGPDDPLLGKDMKEARERAEIFARAHRETLGGDIDRELFLAVLREYEHIHEIGLKPCFYANLLFSEHTRDPKSRELLDETREEWNEIERLLLPFRLKMMSLPGHRIEDLTEPEELSNYRHFLLDLKRHQPFALKEAEEVAAARKKLKERTVLSTRYDEIMGMLSISVADQGEDRQLKVDEVMALLHQPDPSPRAQAFGRMHEAIAEQGTLFKDILNGLLMHHLQDSLQRGHFSPMHKSLMANGLGEDMVENMLGSVERHYPIAERYFRLRAGRLGLEKMAFTDQFVPLGRETISFAQARSLLLASMEAFHPRFSEAARGFF